jgi:hypothetical protein
MGQATHADGISARRIQFALMLGGARFRDAVRLLLPLLAVKALGLIPLT